MEYPPDAGPRGEGSDLLYLQNQAQGLATHNAGYYQPAAQYHQFVDKKYHDLGFGKPNEELLVPACQGSGSSEASDDGLLRYAFSEPFPQQDTPRCDSSRSETGESTCSSISSGSGTDDGLVRVPLLLPQGYAPDYLHQSSLVRVGHPNGLKFVKPGDNGVYYVRQQGDSEIRPAGLVGPPQPPQPSTPLQPVPVGWRRLLVDNSIIYLTPSNVALNNMDQVKMYLQSSGTCKCGLECPLYCHQVFNFNPKIPSRPWDASDSEMTKLCNHKRKTPDTVPAGAGLEQGAVAIPVPPAPPQLSAPATNQITPVDTKEFPPTVKKKKKKQATYSGVSVSQLLAQRERERAMAAAAVAAAANGPRWPAPPRAPAPLYPETFAMQPQLIGMRPQDPFTAMCPPGTVRRSIPPWHQARFAVRKPLAPYERVPPLQQHMPPPNPIPAPMDDAAHRKKHKAYKTKRKPHEPSFMDDPNGYLAQQTALLHNTIARPNFLQGVPLPSNVLGNKRPSHQPCNAASCIDCSTTTTNNNGDSPVTSTVPADPRPIQGGAISTSNGSPTPHEPTPVCALPAQSPSNLLVSSSSPASKSPAPPRRDVVQTIQTSTSNGHILVSSTGQYLGGLKLNQPMGTVLVNALPAPFVLQPGVMTVDTGLGQMAVAGNVLVDNPPPLLSPEKKKKAKKRKGTPLGSPILQVPPSNNMVLNQGFGGMQAVTLVQGMQGMQGKPVVVNNPINVLQPVVPNFPFQQFLVPSLGNMVMASDGSTTLLQEHSMPQLQLQQLQPLITNSSFISTPAGMLIRSPNSLMGQVSPPEYIQILPQSNATAVVQQNTTIVQQQTMLSPGQDKALELEIVASHSSTTAADVSTQTAPGKETNHTFCQTVGSPPDTTTSSPVADTTTDDQQTVSSSVTDDKLRLQGYLSPNGQDDCVGSSHSDMDSQTVLLGDAGDTRTSPITGYVRSGDADVVEGDLVWGPVRGSPAWPGKMVSSVGPNGFVYVRWFGSITRSPTRIHVSELQTLSQGLDAHHQASTTPKRTRKLRVELEAAIQEAMAELDKMADQKRKQPNVSGRSRRSLR